MTGMTAINCIVAHFAEKSYKKSLHDTENFTVLPIICFWYGRQTVAKNGQRIFLQVDTTIMIFYGFNKQKIRLMEQIAIACNIGKELVAVFIFCPATAVREAGVERMLLRKHQNAAAV